MESLLVEVSAVVNGSSDLRYGRFSHAPGVGRNSGLDLADTLSLLQTTCLQSQIG